MVTQVREDIILNGKVVGEFSAVIGGDETPVVMTVQSEVLTGYTPDGYPIMTSDIDEGEVDRLRAEFTIKIMKQHEVLKTLDL